MRYGLRTLLIAITLFGLAMSRIAYLKERATFHRLKADALIPRIALKEQEREEIIAINVRQLANIGAASRDLVRHDNGLSASVGKSEWDSHQADWQSAVSHQILASRYESALYRPWRPVASDPTHRP